MTKNQEEPSYLKGKCVFSEGGKVVKKWQCRDFSILPWTKIYIEYWLEAKTWEWEFPSHNT